LIVILYRKLLISLSFISTKKLSVASTQKILNNCIFEESNT